MGYYAEKYKTVSSEISSEIQNALQSVNPASVEALVNEILHARKVFFIGVGRVMLSLEAIAKRLAHLGIETHCVGEITEPAITKADLLIVGSGSGNSIIPVAIAKKANSFGAKIVHIGSNPHGDMSQIADLMVRIPVRTKLGLEDEIDSKQLMTSLFEQSLLVFGDVLAKMIADEKGLDLNELWQKHANLE